MLLHPARPWDCRPTDEERDPAPEPGAWPPVAVLVPARNEAATLPQTLPALLAQGYPGAWSAVLVDDRSHDGTAAVARALAAGDPRLRAVEGAPLPEGWVGKVWALEQARRAVDASPAGAPDLLLLTDADIRHAPGSLRRLVAEAQATRLDLVSRMARLRCSSRAERLLIPPFVLFFFLLYPCAGPTGTAAGGRGRGRVHAGAPLGPRGGGRARGDPRGPDRRPRPGAR